MEGTKANDMTEDEYIEACTKIRDLQMRELMGENHTKEIAGLKELINYKEEDAGCLNYHSKVNEVSKGS